MVVDMAAMQPVVLPRYFTVCEYARARVRVEPAFLSLAHDNPPRTSAHTFVHIQPRTYVLIVPVLSSARPPTGVTKE